MYTLFNTPSGRAPLKLITGHTTYLLNAQQENLARVIHYYRNSSYSLASSHLLVRLLQNLPGPFYPNLDFYQDQIADQTEELAQPLRLFSSVRRGTLKTPGVFLGETGSELIIAHSEPFSNDEIRTNWATTSPLRWLWHPVDNFNLDRPMGESVGWSKGFSVLLINVALLAVQYRYWRRHQYRLNPESPRSAMQFVAGYVIPNSLGSFIDIALVQCWFKRLRGELLIEEPDQHPFYLNPRTAEMQKEIDQTLAAYLRNRTRFGDLLEGVSGIHTNSLRAAIAFPEFPKTRPLVSAFSLARLPVIEALLEWDQQTGKQRHRAEKNQIKKSLVQLQSDKVWQQLGATGFPDALSERLETRVLPFL
jgi:hypothetical protein